MATTRILGDPALASGFPTVDTTGETFTAGEPMPIHRAVWLNLAGYGMIAHANDLDETESIIGISDTPAPPLGQFAARTDGEMEFPTWNWTPGATIYAQDDGTLGESPGTFEKQVARVLSPTKSQLDIELTDDNAAAAAMSLLEQRVIDLENQENEVHIQSTASTAWTFNHNLGRIPNIQALDTGLREIEGVVDHINNLVSIIRFNVPVAGIAYAG